VEVTSSPDAGQDLGEMQVDLSMTSMSPRRISDMPISMPRTDRRRWRCRR
jgi:hypothetical protein